MCNLNCFKCPYEDCINDKITHREMKEIDKFDREITYEQADGDRKKLRKPRGYDRKYYLKNKDKILQKQRENSEKRRKYNREYYRRNAEKERQRKREEYHRKKEQVS